VLIMKASDSMKESFRLGFAKARFALRCPNCECGNYKRHGSVPRALADEAVT
jgi:hypothetical protein